MDIKSIIESILLVSEKPVKVKELAAVLELKSEEVVKSVKDLIEDYKEKGIRITRKDNELFYTTAPENAKYISKYLNEELRSDLSQVALEVLAIVVYKQPITRVEVEEIRGINSDYLVRNLHIRGLIKEVGRKEAIGKPILYGTTLEFLNHFGLQDESQIPELQNITNQEENIITVDSVTEVAG